ncbi:SMK killer toxin resistance protein [Imshaugia aleurites]|uniref:SMK killer toxin resistance protein n=1 Tax=Imshaugia aleurites TaxID=172621 RepID=A0A8H3F361_9LECA|nr:SMK killer toxin resistance protein [Imshaugia aleurites]
MATFFADLISSIFTPGPTPSIIIATNASFAALQVVLLLLLIITYSIHFVVLSFLCAGLWWGINWFVTELESANRKEKDAKQSSDMKKGQGPDARKLEDSGTETEGGGTQIEEGPSDSILGSQTQGLLRPDDVQGAMRKRISSAEASSGDLSTDSEWDKVSEAEEVGR